MVQIAKEKSTVKQYVEKIPTLKMCVVKLRFFLKKCNTFNLCGTQNLQPIHFIAIHKKFT